jgi:hypothetical protein
VLARPAEFLVTNVVSPYFYGADGDGSPSFGNRTPLTLYRPLAGNPTAWYYIIVKNIGGQNATGVTITATDPGGALPFGQQTATAYCDAASATLAPNASWVCKYQRSYAANGAFSNLASARASNVNPDANDDATATVTVIANASCSGANRVVPLLASRTWQASSGITAGTAQTRWNAAGFTGTFSVSGNGTNSPVQTQSRLAFDCQPLTATMAVTR